MRSFCKNASLLKKKDKTGRETDLDTCSSAQKSELDPFDFSSLNSGIDDRFSKLKSELSKLRTGGRFNPELLENLRVALQRNIKKTERLADLAQVIPKGGRNLLIIAGERAVSRYRALNLTFFLLNLIYLPLY